MMTWIDNLTGRVTMYRIVVICLTALVLAALLLSLLGELRFSPLEILSSAAVLIAATWLSNRLLAAIFRVRPHSESSLISALLLLFLFRPSLDLTTLGVLALAGVIASASKYLLAFRRRHIFNPAALSALVIGLLGLDVAVWWVATPWLLPFAAVGAIVILSRTRRIALGLVFVVLAVGIVTVMNASLGTPVLTALWSAVTSYPIIFFVGFMLSEPLTLPPRRWQQLALAAIVAVLFTVPFSIGPLYSSPEFALVIGNLLAFLAGQRRGIRLDFVSREQLTPGTWEFTFAPQRPISWRAGQYMELTLPHAKTDIRGLRRVFSIASAPSSGGVIRFGMRLTEPSSSFKRAMLQLRAGDAVSATSVSGDFVLPRDPARPLLLIAGGIGITPFISQLEQLRASGEARDIVIAYACSSADDVAYSDLLKQTGYPVLLAAPEAPAPLPDGWIHWNPVGSPLTPFSPWCRTQRIATPTCLVPPVW